MSESGKQALRAFIKERLEKKRRPTTFSDDDALFTSGKLDSFSMMKLIMELEKMFDVDFSTVDFEASLIDSVNAIVKFVDAK